MDLALTDINEPGARDDDFKESSFDSLSLHEPAHASILMHMTYYT